MRKDTIGDYSTTDSGSEDDYYSEKYKLGETRRNTKSKSIVVRPHASAGFWLCGLFPLTYLVHFLKDGDCSSISPNTNMLSIASVGMCVESLCFFMYMFLDTNLLLKLLMSLMPGILTSVLFKVLLQQNWWFGIFWGFTVTLCYQNIYIRVMRGLPQCFSFGEATLVVQGLMLFVLNAVLQLPTLLFGKRPNDEFSKLNAIVIFAMLCLVCVCFLLALFARLRQPIGFYLLMGGLVMSVTCIPVTLPFPLATVWKFIFSDNMRITIIGFYLLLVGLTSITVWLQLRNAQKASTIVRKVFHIVIVLVYLPGIIYQCHFLYLASAVALAIMSVLELFRILNIPPIASALNNAFALFSDEKDAGGVALTPFSLLIGCSIPLWLNQCPCPSSNQTSIGSTNLSQLAGILVLGFGDTAASVIGSKFGRIKWRGTQRSLEGTIAFIVVIMLAVVVLNCAELIRMSLSSWIVVSVATLISALVEAQTDQVDNLVLPFIFYAIVSLV